MEITKILLIFVIGSIFGWFFEFLYRSMEKQKIINPGYLRGFYLPIYGIGAVLIYFISLLNLNLPLKIFLFGITTTLLEFIVGIIFKTNGIFLWKYRKKDSITYKGIICLKCSILWIIFSLIFYFFIFPIIQQSLILPYTFFIYFVILMMIIDLIIKMSITTK